MKKTLDWKQYLDVAANAAAEGIVMLRNEKQALPLIAGEQTAVFGRIQLHYYKSGTGSGGMVNVSKVTGILDGLLEHGVRVDEALLEEYRRWDAEHPFDLGDGWGQEPWSQKEMPLTDAMVQAAAERSTTAIVIIGRTAGEEQDNTLDAGSLLLSDGETEMLRIVRKHFDKVILLLNVGNIIEMQFMDDAELCPDAVLYVWQGGMTGGTGAAKVLTGEMSPCGKLPDTIPVTIADYPSDPYFGGRAENSYAEDIFVGYRYFETFAKEKVRYPFGFGLSYTTFDVRWLDREMKPDMLEFNVAVKNTGSCPGKEVVQVYCEAPQGRLGKPSRVLCGYAKTGILNPGEEETLCIHVHSRELASYDDKNNCWILEHGDYRFYVGTDVRSAAYATALVYETDVIAEQCRQALAPVQAFDRMTAVQAGDSVTLAFAPVPLRMYDEDERRLADLPEEIPFTGNKGILLRDVRDGRHTMEEFIAQLTDTELACIIRGEGMGSPRVTPGTASAFGGVTDALSAYGIPAACCSDGPSGMRLDCGTKAFSLPNGTLLAATFNCPLMTELFALTGLEMTANKVDCLLGPGMNLHRHPLNGRNFEYFSEDPFLTGSIAAAELRGLHSAGVTGTIKHFCGNNQETGRHILDSIISERALRELYLKGFEIAVRDGNADSIMTTYGKVNGLYTAGSYDLNTEILRKEWKFDGFVMTDWWADINERGEAADRSNFARMAKAQNDVYMVCADSSNHEDNTLAALENGTLTRAELQRNASNICKFLLHTNAMKRLCGEDAEVTILNRPADAQDNDGEVIFYPMDTETEIPVDGISTDKGKTYSFALDLKKQGGFRVTVTASSTQSELAQIPLTLFCMGTASGTLTFNGTGGEPVSLSRVIPMFSRFTTIRLYFAQSGLKLHNIRIEYVGPMKLQID